MKYLQMDNNYLTIAVTNTHHMNAALPLYVTLSDSLLKLSFGSIIIPFVGLFKFICLIYFEQKCLSGVVLSVYDDYICQEQKYCIA